MASAAEIGTLTASSSIVGRDGASTALVWGHEVWMFGDTFLALANAEGMNFVSNTFATSAASVTDAGITLVDRLDDVGAPSEILWPTPSELAYDVAHESAPDGSCDEQPCGGRYATWPGATVFDPSDGGTALVFYGLVSAAPGSFNFEGIGSGIAVWTDFDASPARPAPGVCDGGPPTALFCASEPGYGSGAALVDGFVYTFACTKDGFGYPCQLGRVPFARALDRSAWSYWDGATWASDYGSSAVLFVGGLNVSFQWNAYLAAWMAVYSEPFSNDVGYRTAPQLTGPWSGEATLFTATSGPGGGTAYDAYPHPELAEQDGQVQYVTYSRSNGTEFGDDFALVRVTFR